jgi:hypothetical protein
MFESVVVHFAVTNGFNSTKQGDGGPAIAFMKDHGVLPEQDGGNYVQGLWDITHTNGPHPGKSTAREGHCRLLNLTGAGRYLIDKLGPPGP